MLHRCGSPVLVKLSKGTTLQKRLTEGGVLVCYVLALTPLRQSHRGGYATINGEPGTSLSVYDLGNYLT